MEADCPPERFSERPKGGLRGDRPRGAVVHGALGAK
jgi:hypothetical protein